MRNLIVAALAGLSLSACADTAEYPLAPNMVRLDVSPPTEPFIREATLRRAAELTLEHGYSAFRLDPKGLDAEALELDLIDFGLEEMGESAGEKGEPQMLVRCAFADFGSLQKALEDRKITPISAESEYVPTNPVSLGERETTEVLRLIDSLEQDDDVQKVFHNLA